MVEDELRYHWENVLLEGLSYAQQSRYQNNCYLTWKNLINCRGAHILSLVRVTFHNFRNISREISFWGRNHLISRNDMRCLTLIYNINSTLKITSASIANRFVDKLTLTGEKSPFPFNICSFFPQHSFHSPFNITCFPRLTSS